MDKLCRRSFNAKSKFEKLSDNTNNVLLTRAAIGKKYQTTFVHSIVDVPILSAGMYCVARSNMKAGTSIKLDHDSLFKDTSAIRAPTILELIKVKTEEKFKNLVASTSVTSNKLSYYAVLTPSLAEAFQYSNMRPCTLFL